MAAAPLLHGRYPLPRYYEPLRLPTTAARTVMSFRAASDLHALPCRVSQVPQPFCPHALSPSTPAGPVAACSRYFATGDRASAHLEDWPPTLCVTRSIRV